MRPRRHPEPRAPFVLEDARGRTWTILHTAERSYLAAASALHPEITAELLADVHLVRRTDSALEVWRASRAFDRIYLVVEPVEGGYRVCEVRPGHPREAGSGRVHAPIRSAAPSSTPAPPLPPGSTQASPPPAFTAAQMLALVTALDGWRRGGPFPGYPDLTRVTGLPRAELVGAVAALEQYPDAPVHQSRPWSMSHRPEARARPVDDPPSPPREARRANSSSQALAARLVALGLEITAWQVHYGLHPEERQQAREWADARGRGKAARLPLALRRYKP